MHPHLQCSSPLMACLITCFSYSCYLLQRSASKQAHLKCTVILSRMALGVCWELGEQDAWSNLGNLWFAFVFENSIVSWEMGCPMTSIQPVYRRHSCLSQWEGESRAQYWMTQRGGELACNTMSWLLLLGWVYTWAFGFVKVKVLMHRLGASKSVPLIMIGWW